MSLAALDALIETGQRLVANEVFENAANGQAILDLLVEVTHDLRSPLGAMLILIEQLRAGSAGPVTPLQEQRLGVLYEATLEASNITQSALELARMSTRGASIPISTSFSVADTWKGVRALVAPIAEDRSLALRWAGPLEDRRIGNPHVLHRVLVNLVTNALKFTSSGSITVATLELGEDILRFEVRDTGPGLNAAARSLVDGVPVRGPIQAPSGLGLTICRKMLESVGSQLRFGHFEGTGAIVSFDMHLPISR